MKKIKRFFERQQGSVSVLVALTLPVLVGAGALAVDLAYLHVVRNELQNDADAAALAGARKLYLRGASALDWSGAANTASHAIALNSAAGHTLADGQVQTGYWDTTQAATGLQGLPMTPGRNDAPAVQVSLGKSEDQNQGPVRTFLASIWGVYAKPVRVTAVAGVSSPGRIQPGGLFPYAVSKCLYEKFWDMSTQPAAPRVDPVTGQVPEFKIGSLYHYANCGSGEWTSLDTQASGATTIEKLIAAGNPISLSVGDTVWMQTGVKTNLFTIVKNCSAAGTRQCEFVVVPVLEQVVSGASSTIVGFACLQLLDAVGGNEKYILAKMSNQCPPPLSGGVGPNYGVISPPSLFK
jgi:Flp pilus assembly protein TadG